MWISVVTYSVEAVRTNSANLNILRDIQIKAQEMIDNGLGGDLMPGYENAANITANTDQTSVEVKRGWHTQEAAETFVNYVLSNSDGVATGQVESG
jgi:hypothetical protein